MQKIADGIILDDSFVVEFETDNFVVVFDYSYLDYN
jgi:hypothetical protein